MADETQANTEDAALAAAAVDGAPATAERILNQEEIDSLLGFVEVQQTKIFRLCCSGGGFFQPGNRLLSQIEMNRGGAAAASHREVDR